MQDRAFIDTNLWIYLFLRGENWEDQQKRKVTKEVLRTLEDLIVSTQVLNELSNVLLKKYGVDHSKVVAYIRRIIHIAEVKMLTEEDTLQAISLTKRYGLAFYDALIVSAALESNCAILLTEDMQDGLIIKRCLTIKNPFVNISGPILRNSDSGSITP